jgi:hypothetical protein
MNKTYQLRNLTIHPVLQLVSFYKELVAVVVAASK